MRMRMRRVCLCVCVWSLSVPVCLSWVFLSPRGAARGMPRPTFHGSLVQIGDPQPQLTIIEIPPPPFPPFPPFPLSSPSADARRVAAAGLLNQAEAERKAIVREEQLIAIESAMIAEREAGRQHMAALLAEQEATAASQARRLEQAEAAEAQAAEEGEGGRAGSPSSPNPAAVANADADADADGGKAASAGDGRAESTADAAAPGDDAPAPDAPDADAPDADAPDADGPAPNAKKAPASPSGKKAASKSRAASSSKGGSSAKGTKTPASSKAKKAASAGTKRKSPARDGAAGALRGAMPSLDDPVPAITEQEWANLQALMEQFCRVPLLAEFSRPVSQLHPEVGPAKGGGGGGLCPSWPARLLSLFGFDSMPLPSNLSLSEVLISPTNSLPSSSFFPIHSSSQCTARL